MGDEYDAETCITARELRAMGCDISEEVPDCAWVPRSSIAISLGGVEPHPSDADCAVVTVNLRCAEPFRWVSMTVDVDYATLDRPAAVDVPPSSAPSRGST